MKLQNKKDSIEFANKSDVIIDNRFDITIEPVKDITYTRYILLGTKREGHVFTRGFFMPK